MPELLILTISTDPAGDPWAGFTAATAYARAGFPVLPIEPGGKRPLVIGPFRHGARSATNDPEAVRDAWLQEPAANVGISPATSVAILDVDPRNGSTLEAAEAMGLPIDGYRERSGSGGWHLPLTIPPGYDSVRSATIGPGLELKGRGSYVVSPHSRLADGGVYRHDRGSPFIWPVIPASWPQLERITRRSTLGTYDLGRITPSHRREARKVLDCLCRDRYGPQVMRILAGDWTWRYPTASERDAGIALMASFWTREPEVLAAVIGQVSDLARKRNPADYVNRTVAVALAERALRSEAAKTAATVSLLQRFGPGQREIGTPDGPLTEALDSPRVFYAHPITQYDRHREILRFVANASERDEAGFVRLPIGDLAISMSVHRNTIANDLQTLERSALLETFTRYASPYRRERWARLAN